MHNKMARELTKIANECGISATCYESKLQYRDAGPLLAAGRGTGSQKTSGLIHGFEHFWKMQREP